MYDADIIAVIHNRNERRGDDALMVILRLVEEAKKETKKEDKKEEKKAAKKETKKAAKEEKEDK